MVPIMTGPIVEDGEPSHDTPCRSMWGYAEPEVTKEAHEADGSESEYVVWRVRDSGDVTTSTAPYPTEREAVYAWNSMMRCLVMMWGSMSRHDRTDPIPDDQLSLMGLSRRG